MRAPRGTLLRAGMTIILCLAVASCTDEPDPGTIKSPSPTPTSSSASPAPSTPEAQIEAAVRAYYAELTRAAQTNDTSKLKTMTTTGCPCFRAVGVIEKNQKAGETTPDAEFRLVSVKVHDVEEGNGLATVRTRDAAYDVIRNGEVVDHVAATTTNLQLSLVKSSSGQWIIGNEFNLGGA